ncbi:MAG TPA: hypothetical protein VHM70_03910 [Polyangiaceae bacterium]|nr:hypothetical protein [Polyangiaceae bacterium]
MSGTVTFDGCLVLVTLDALATLRAAVLASALFTFFRGAFPSFVAVALLVFFAVTLLAFFFDDFFEGPFEPGVALERPDAFDFFSAMDRFFFFAAINHLQLAPA